MVYLIFGLTQNIGKYMQEITIKLSLDAFNRMLQALADSVNFNQQNTSILISSLQGQANAQLQLVVQTPPQV